VIAAPHFPSVRWLCLLLLVIPLVAVCEDTGRPIPEDGGPTPVTVDIFALDLDAIDGAAQSFDANVYAEARWKDPRLADPDRQTSRTLPLDTVWNPRFQILNQQRTWRTLPRVVEVTPDGSVTQRGRAWGSFSQPLDLRKFPFDTQRISIILTTAGFEGDEVKLLPGTSSGIADALSIADWRLTDWKITTDVPIPGPPDASDVDGIALVLTLERLKAYYWLKVIAPLILIVAMSWAVFWIDPKELGTKISITITAMLTLIAYRFAIGASLPPVSYLTKMDWFILLSTVLVYASLVAVIVTASLERRSRRELAKAVDQMSRWGFPLFFLGAWIVIAVLA
jgi:hypothetical protein